MSSTFILLLPFISDEITKKKKKHPPKNHTRTHARAHAHIRTHAHTHTESRTVLFLHTFVVMDRDGFYEDEVIGSD